MQCRHLVRLAQPERPQLRGVRLGALVVDLVGREQSPGASDRRSTRAIASSVAVAPTGRVDDDEDRVGWAHRPLRLRGDRGLQPLGARLPAAGVDHGEPAAPPQRVVGDPVPGHARHVLHDGLAAPDDPVHQRRLADVRAGRRRRASAPAPTSASPASQLGEIVLPAGELGLVGPACRPQSTSAGTATSAGVAHHDLAGPDVDRGDPPAVAIGGVEPDRRARPAHAGSRSEAAATARRPAPRCTVERLPDERPRPRVETACVVAPSAGPCRASRPARRSRPPHRQPRRTGIHGGDQPLPAGALREDADRAARLQLSRAPAATVLGPARRGSRRTARRSSAASRVRRCTASALTRNDTRRGSRPNRHVAVHEVLVIGDEHHRSGTPGSGSMPARSASDTAARTT